MRLQPTDPLVLSEISKILEKQSELFVDVWHPPQQEGSDSYFLRTVSDFISLARDEQPWALFSISRSNVYPLQGFVDDNFARQALDLVPDGKSWTIVDNSCFPAKVRSLGYGDTHHAMKLQLKRMQGTWVRFGSNFGLPSWSAWDEKYPEFLIVQKS